MEGKTERRVDNGKKADGGRRKTEQENRSTDINRRLFVLWRDRKNIKSGSEENNSEGRREGEG